MGSKGEADPRRVAPADQRVLRVDSFPRTAGSHPEPLGIVGGGRATPLIEPETGAVGLAATQGCAIATLSPGLGGIVPTSAPAPATSTFSRTVPDALRCKNALRTGPFNPLGSE